MLWGGGNNSVKVGATDPAGNPIQAMYVKGSGSDMKSIVASEYPGVRLDYIAPLSGRDSMSDEEMVEFLARCLLDPGSKRPSIETLLHGFLPAAAVLHTHADAILAVTNTRGREAAVRECFGDGVVTIPYLRPGFALSRQVASALAAHPGAEAVVLMNHGLITWGETPREAYRKHIALVTRAENFAGLRVTSARDPKDREPRTEDRGLVQTLAPKLRGLLGRVILEFDDSPEVLAFLSRNDLQDVASRGAATPDHLLYTKRFPMILAGPEDDPNAALQQYQQDYETYFREHAAAGDTMLDARPRVVLVPGAGMWTAGKDARGARIVRDIYRHTIGIITAAESRGGFQTLSDRDAFEAEYWPLELYKLTLRPKDRDLAGQVALITGAAGAIGSVIAKRFAEEGAHVVLTDRRPEVKAVADAIVQQHGLRRATSFIADLTDETQVARLMEEAVAAFGGVDVVVSNAGISHVSPLDELPREMWEQSLAVNTTAHFFVVRETLRVMKRQAAGGSIVFIATKNVTSPGKHFGAYSVSKAAEAQLCRIAAIEGGEFGIRANMINPDAVFEGSGLWGPEMRKGRADAHGLKVEELPEFYRQRNLLKAAVTSEDVAESALFLASSRSAKTTGAMIPVDGGLREAFPR